MRITFTLLIFLLLSSCSGLKEPKKEKKAAYNKIPIENVEFYDNSIYGNSFSEFNSDECNQSYLKISLTDFDLAKKYEKKIQTNSYNPLIRIKVRYNDTISQFIMNPITNKGDNFFTRNIKNKTLIRYVPYYGGEVQVSMSFKMFKADEKLKKILEVIDAPLDLIPIDYLLYKESAIELLTQIDSLSEMERNIFSFDVTLDDDKRRNLTEGFYLAHEEKFELNASDVFISNEMTTYTKEDKEEKTLNETTSYAVFEFEESIMKKINLIDDKSIMKQRREMEKHINRSRKDTSHVNLAEDAFLDFNDNLIDSEELTRNEKHIISKSAFKDLLKGLGRNNAKYKSKVNWLPDPCNRKSDTTIVGIQKELNKMYDEAYSREFNQPLLDKDGKRIKSDDLEPKQKANYDKWIKDTKIGFAQNENTNLNASLYYKDLKESIRHSCKNPKFYIFNSNHLSEQQILDFEKLKKDNSDIEVFSYILLKDFSTYFSFEKMKANMRLLVLAMSISMMTLTAL